MARLCGGAPRGSLWRAVAVGPSLAILAPVTAWCGAGRPAISPSLTAFPTTRSTLSRSRPRAGACANSEPGCEISLDPAQRTRALPQRGSEAGRPGDDPRPRDRRGRADPGLIPRHGARSRKKLRFYLQMDRRPSRDDQFVVGADPLDLTHRADGWWFPS